MCSATLRGMSEILYKITESQARELIGARVECLSDSGVVYQSGPVTGVALDDHPRGAVGLCIGVYGRFYSWGDWGLRVLQPAQTTPSAPIPHPFPEKPTLEQAKTLIGAEVALLADRGKIERARGFVTAAERDSEGDTMIEIDNGMRSWPGYGEHQIQVIAPAPASATVPPAAPPAVPDESPAARVSRLRAELERAQAELQRAESELEAVEPAFPEGWSMRDGETRSDNDELIALRDGIALLIEDEDGDRVMISIAAMRAFLARIP